MKQINKQPLRITIDAFALAITKCVLGRPQINRPKTLVLSVEDYSTIFTKGESAGHLVYFIDTKERISLEEAASKPISTKNALPQKVEEIGLNGTSFDERDYFREFQARERVAFEEWNEMLPIPKPGEIRITCDEILERTVKVIRSFLKQKNASCMGIELNELRSEYGVYSALNARNVTGTDRYQFAEKMSKCVKSLIEDKYGRLPKEPNERESKPNYDIRRLVDGTFEAFRCLPGGGIERLGSMELRGHNLILIQMALESCKQNKSAKHPPKFNAVFGEPKELASTSKAVSRFNDRWREITGVAGRVLTFKKNEPGSDVLAECIVNCSVTEQVPFERQRGNFQANDISFFANSMDENGKICDDKGRRKKGPSKYDENR